MQQLTTLAKNLTRAAAGQPVTKGGGMMADSELQPPAAAAGFDLRDEDGTVVRLVANSEPFAVRDFKGTGLDLALQQPIYFCPCARLARAQQKAQPVLFMAAADWEQLRRPAITHEGAFGRDSERWAAGKVAAHRVPPPAAGGAGWVRHTNGGRAFFRVRGDDATATLCAPAAAVEASKEEAGPEDAGWFEERWAGLQAAAGRAGDWVAVWKFPGDLNELPTFRRIEALPLPVGCYPMLDDGWWAGPGPEAGAGGGGGGSGGAGAARPELPELPAGGPVEKLRADLPGGSCVHHLEQPWAGGARVAAISSSYFIEGYWAGQPASLPQVLGLLQELHGLGIYAFPCYGQHHAIVFYADYTPAAWGARRWALLTPRALAQLLAGDGRGAAVLAALQKAALPVRAEELQRWRDDYVQVYGPPAVTLPPPPPQQQQQLPPPPPPPLLCVMMRGLPGSGKSTRVAEHSADAARRGVRCAVCSADDYFVTLGGGTYKFDHTLIGAAHARCKQTFTAAIQQQAELVVVDNTNTQEWEFEPYLRAALAAGYTVVVEEIRPRSKAEAEHAWARNTHGVPKEAAQRMFERWEDCGRLLRAANVEVRSLPGPGPRRQ